MWKKLSFGKNLLQFYLGPSSTAINQSVYNMLNEANIVSLKESFVKNGKSVEIQLIASKLSDENDVFVSGRCIWPKNGFFAQQTNNFNLVKANIARKQHHLCKSSLYDGQKY